MVCAYEEKKNVNKYAVRSDLATHKFILILKHAMFDCYRIYARKKTRIWSSAIESILKHLCRFIYNTKIVLVMMIPSIRSSMIKYLRLKMGKFIRYRPRRLVFN